jgi:hypothetical protein
MEHGGTGAPARSHRPLHWSTLPRIQIMGRHRVMPHHADRSWPSAESAEWIVVENNRPIQCPYKVSGNEPWEGVVMHITSEPLTKSVRECIGAMRCAKADPEHGKAPGVREAIKWDRYVDINKFTPSCQSKARMLQQSGG